MAVATIKISPLFKQVLKGAARFEGGIFHPGVQGAAPRLAAGGCASRPGDRSYERPVLRAEGLQLQSLDESVVAVVGRDEG